MKLRGAIVLILAFSAAVSGCGPGGKTDAPAAPYSPPGGSPESGAEQPRPAEPAPPAVFFQDGGGPDRRGAGAGLAPRFPLEPLWHHAVGGAYRSGPAVDLDRLYVMGTDGNLVCLSRSDGRLLWTFAVQPPAFSAPAAGDGVVYAADGTGAVYAVRAGDGVEIWKRETGEPSAAPLLLADGVVVAAGSRGGVSAFRAADGELLWKSDLKAPVHAAPSAGDGRIYLGTETGAAVALSAADGRELWRRNVRGAVRAPLVPGDDGVFGSSAGSSGGGYYLLDAASGEIRWSQSLAAGIIAPAASEKGRVVFADTEGTVFAVDPATGILRWRTKLFEPVSAGLLLVDGNVMAATEESLLYRLDAETGKISGRAALPRGVSTPPVCLDGIVYIGTVRRGFSAFRGAEEGGKDAFIPLPGEHVFPPILAAGRETEVFLPPEGMQVKVPPLSGRHYVEVAGDTLRPVTLKLLNPEGTVLAENLGYTALEKGFAYRFEANASYVVKAEPVRLDEGLVPARLRIRPVGAAP